MLIASRGVTWDRAGKARVLSILARVLIVLGAIFAWLPFNLVHNVAVFTLMAGFTSLLLGFGMSLDAPRELPGEVHVDAYGNLQVTIGKRRRSRKVARERVRGAWVIRRVINERDFHWVEIALRTGTTVSVRVDDEQQGIAMVEALGFGIAGRAMAIPLAKRTRRLLHLVFGGVAYVLGTVIGAFFGPLLFYVVPIVYELLRFLFRPPVLEIGTDAMRVGIGVRRMRILREQVARIVFFAPASLIVEKKDGTKLRILPLALDPARVAAAAQIVDARLGDRPAPARANAFERAGRNLSEWRAGLRTALDPSYRASGATIDDASLVLTSPTSSVEQRIGAALALRIAGEPLERVRIAAESAVDPKVRVVLDAIADGADDERVDETLRAMAR